MLSYSAGVLLTCFFVSQLAIGEVQRKQDIAQFEQVMESSTALQVASIDPGQASPAIASSASMGVSLAPEQAGAPDTTLWAPGRIADYEASMESGIPQVLGLLEVPSVGLRVPVYPSDSELNMDRGAGIIDGMAYPHEPGNIGIAGHRDGYSGVVNEETPVRLTGQDFGRRLCPQRTGCKPPTHVSV